MKTDLQDTEQAARLTAEIMEQAPLPNMSIRGIRLLALFEQYTPNDFTCETQKLSRGIMAAFAEWLAALPSEGRRVLVEIIDEPEE